MQISTDQHDRLCGFPHHDGYLEGVTLQGGAEVRLVVRPTHGPRLLLTLSGVVDFCMDDLREGNTINVMFWIPADRVSAHPSVASRLEQRLYLDVSRLLPSQFVFLLECSYGASAVAVGEHIQVCPAQP